MSKPERVSVQAFLFLRKVMQGKVQQVIKQATLRSSL
jgi:hypothetical protein